MVHVVEFLGERVGVAILRSCAHALRRDESLRAKYLGVKEHAVADSPADRVRYNELKGPFLAKITG